jgi:hypothetical protein
MRITEGQLRRIIREELETHVDEMAWKGRIGISGDPGEDTSALSGQPGLRGPNKPGAEKFARSGRFQKLAELQFANIPFDVWTVPFVGAGTALGVRQDELRGRMMPLTPDGMETLQRLGYKGTDRVEGDDLVILYTTMTTDPGYIATPWMIVHALFDSSEISGELSPTWAQVGNDFVEGWSESFPEIGPIIDDDFTGSSWYAALTMRSAREGRIGPQGDALSEIMCQELLTSGGFRFDPDAISEEEVGALTALKGLVRRAAAEFRQAARGKLIIVEVN